MKKKIIIAIVIVAAIFAGLVAVKALQIGKMISAGKSFTMPPETISSAVAQEQSWQDTLTAVGSISAAQGVTVAAEVAGTVTEIAFESGAVVAKGDLLVRLDTSSEAAQLRAAQAEVELTKLNLDRLLKLRESNVVSQSEVDTAQAALKQNQANADAISAIIEKKTIRAPFAGRLGIRLVNLGESLDARKPIVSLQSLVPVYGDFSLPQQTLSVLTTGLVVQVSSDAYPGEKFIGEVTAIDPELDATTRAVRLQATFANTNQLLRPGMFANTNGAGGAGDGHLERAVWRFGLCDRALHQFRRRVGGAPAVRPHRPAARRFREHRDRAETRRARRELGPLQNAQRRGRGDQQ